MQDIPSRNDGQRARPDSRELPTNSPGFTLDAGHGFISSQTDPRYEELPAVPGIRGIKITGAATYTHARLGPPPVNSDAVLSLYTTGDAHDGLLPPPRSQASDQCDERSVMRRSILAGLV